MLFNNRTAMFIVTWDKLAVLTGYRIIFLFCVDAFDFCRSFKVAIITTICYKVHFLRQNGTNCKLCRVIYRFLEGYVVAHSFNHEEKLINFDKCLAVSFGERLNLKTSFTFGWVSWELKGATCWCWKQFLKNVYHSIMHCFLSTTTEKLLVETVEQKLEKAILDGTKLTLWEMFVNIVPSSHKNPRFSLYSFIFYGSLFLALNVIRDRNFFFTNECPPAPGKVGQFTTFGKSSNSCGFG